MLLLFDEMINSRWFRDTRKCLIFNKVCVSCECTNVEGGAIWALAWWSVYRLYFRIGRYLMIGTSLWSSSEMCNITPGMQFSSPRWTFVIYHLWNGGWKICRKVWPQITVIIMIKYYQHNNVYLSRNNEVRISHKVSIMRSVWNWIRKNVPAMMSSKMMALSLLGNIFRVSFITTNPQII